jgi:putative membrane protein insertion efficiency factor
MIGRLAARMMILVARGWQLTFSAILPPTCRFAPSCSAYAIEAIERHGPIKGGALALRRILRCHPWGGSGFDPVPGSETIMKSRPCCGPQEGGRA